MCSINKVLTRSNNGFKSQTIHFRPHRPDNSCQGEAVSVSVCLSVVVFQTNGTLLLKCRVQERIQLSLLRNFNFFYGPNAHKYIIIFFSNNFYTIFKIFIICNLKKWRELRLSKQNSFKVVVDTYFKNQTVNTQLFSIHHSFVTAYTHNVQTISFICLLIYSGLRFYKL